MYIILILLCTNILYLFGENGNSVLSGVIYSAGPAGHTFSRDTLHVLTPGYSMTCRWTHCVSKTYALHNMCTYMYVQGAACKKSTYSRADTVFRWHPKTMNALRAPLDLTIASTAVGVQLPLATVSTVPSIRTLQPRYLLK